jgi:hypothetical protein
MKMALKIQVVASDRHRHVVVPRSGGTRLCFYTTGDCFTKLILCRQSKVTFSISVNELNARLKIRWMFLFNLIALRNK